MSVNQKTNQFLKEVFTNNPDTENIELEFMQISDLVPFLQLLAKFLNLKKLSLHGNRIKDLPVDLSSLHTLQQIDISNNMLNNCQMMIVSLKTLPKLKRLVCPFKKDEEDKIKKGLPNLQYLNNSKIEREKPKPKPEQPKAIQYKIKQQQFLNPGILHDKMIDCYKQTYQICDQKAMRSQFDYYFDNLTKQYQQRLKSNEPDTVKNIISVTTKFSFYKLTEEKLLDLLNDIDERYSDILGTIFQEYNKNLKNLTDIALSQVSKAQISNLNNTNNVNPVKVNVNQAQLKGIKQKYEKQLKRLKKQRDELLSQINNLEIDNKKYLDTIIRHTKGDAGYSSTVGGKRQQSSPKRFMTNNQDKLPNHKTKQFIISSAGSTGKTITLKQLKDTIEEIYQSKVKFDQKTYDSKLPRQTMYQYLFTFLNQKYGLKNLTIEWASSIVSGIQMYSNEDNDVAVFGKILRNQCEQEFRYVQSQVKNTICQLLKMHLKTKLPYKTAVQINQILNEKMNNYVNSEECEDIVKYMYNKQDSTDLIEKLRLVYALQPKQPSNATQTRRLTRQEQSSLLMEKEKKRIKYQSFVKCVLDFQLKSHEKFLRPLIQVFKTIDKDADGIVNQQQFTEILNELCQEPGQLVTRFLNIVDPYSTNTITFTQICKLLSNYPENEPVLTRFLKQ